MKKFKKCLSALFLSCFLAFGNVSGCYLEVQAFEWVAPAIGIEEALKALLLLLGVSVGAKAGEEIDWSTLKQDCITFQENQGNSQVAVSQWWADIISGKLNQASECWTSFKSWAKSLVDNNNSFNFESGMTQKVALNSIAAYLGMDNPDITYDTVYNNLINGFCICSYVNNNPNFTIYLFYNSESLILNNNTISSSLDNKLVYSQYICNIKSNYINFITRSDSSKTTNISSLQNVSLFNFSSVVGVPNYNIISSGSSSIGLNVYNDSIINDLSLALQNAISTAIPDVIPLPWENLGDDVSAINDELDSIIEAINSGVLDIADGMQRLLDALNVMAIDTSTDIVYPTNPDKPDGQPDETLQDKVNENKDNMGFTLSGLEKVFPFCIPFDIYAFMTLLVADPVSPVINWPVYNPISKENLYITVDFSEWETVVVLIRYIFDFLFIIGLLLMARALIGGGDSA